MRTAANRPGQPWDRAVVAISRAVYLTRTEHDALGRDMCAVWGFRPVGVVAEPSAPEGRVWLYARPGLERPLDVPRKLYTQEEATHGPRRMVLVFDVNGVLCAKVPEQIGPHRSPPVHVRTHAMGFILRPGAAKLLRVCAAAGHEIWLWSTMQRATVDAVAAQIAPWIPPGRRLSAHDCTEGNMKDLRRVWERSEIRGCAHRTILFDDDPSKGALNPDSLVLVRRFAPAGPYDMQCVTDRGALFMLEAVARRSWS